MNWENVERRNNMSEKLMMTANDVASILGISVGHAYKIIRALNAELESKGFITVAGKVPTSMWNKKFFNESSHLDRMEVC